MKSFARAFLLLGLLVLVNARYVIFFRGWTVLCQAETRFIFFFFFFFSSCSSSLSWYSSSSSLRRWFSPQRQSGEVQSQYSSSRRSSSAVSSFYDSSSRSSRRQREASSSSSQRRDAGSPYAPLSRPTRVSSSSSYGSSRRSRSSSSMSSRSSSSSSFGGSSRKSSSSRSSSASSRRSSGRSSSGGKRGGKGSKASNLGSYWNFAKDVHQSYRDGNSLTNAVGDTAVDRFASYAGEIIPVGKVGKAVNRINDLAQKLGAPREVTDATQTAADIVPSNAAQQWIGFAGRSLHRAARGDWNGFDDQMKQAAQGKAGAPLMGYVASTGIIADIASGKNWKDAVEQNARDLPQDGLLAKAGNALGDAAWNFSQKTLPKLQDSYKNTKESIKNWWSNTRL